MPKTPPSPRSSPPPRSAGARSSAGRFLQALPALVLAWLVALALELLAGLLPGSAAIDITWIVALALGQDLLALVRYLPGLFVLSLPALALRDRRRRLWVLGLTWSALLVGQCLLARYFLIARTPLGADLFAYSWHDIRETVAGAATLGPGVLVACLLPLACLWIVLARLLDRPSTVPSSRAAFAVLAIALLVLLAGPVRLGQHHVNEDGYQLGINKLAFFLDDSVAYLRDRPVAASAGQPPPRTAAKAASDAPLDPRFPFLHRDTTPDTLGPYFDLDPAHPPNLVFIIVEGLGRSFSGPGAELGSFTPFLDALAQRGLYWENFLAVQGRTFAVLPSLLGSLPFADNGVNALGERIPSRIDTLPSILKRQGYRLEFYSGTDLGFDNQRTFLRKQGFDVLVGVDDYGPDYARSNSWGYADGDLLKLVLARAHRDMPAPYVSVIQTVTMHTPYTFPDEDRYREHFERRLVELGVSPERKPAYRQSRDIYASILYTDDALRKFFDTALDAPEYRNTIFILTGDHRLPEIPMASRIDRYHVPLLIVSSLLKQPRKIKAVSSQFDVAPSLLALLAHHAGIRTPPLVTWIGAGLDTAPYFRSLHDFPLKQTKTNLVDFVSGEWFVNQGTLYAMHDGLSIAPADAPDALARVQASFDRFRAANDAFARTLALRPDDDTPWIGYLPELRNASLAVPPPGGRVVVRSVETPAAAGGGTPALDVEFFNGAAQASPTFVPLLVLLREDGSEASETYGSPLSLPPGQGRWVRLTIRQAPPGRYSATVYPSDPETGKRVGDARHGIVVQLPATPAVPDLPP